MLSDHLEYFFLSVHIFQEAPIEKCTREEYPLFLKRSHNPTWIAAADHPDGAVSDWEQDGDWMVIDAFEGVEPASSSDLKLDWWFEHHPHAYKEMDLYSWDQCLAIVDKYETKQGVKRAASQSPNTLRTV